MPELIPADSKVSLPPQPVVMKISPEIARDWLDTRNNHTVTHNRTLSPAVVKRYAEAMKRGNWTLIHQGLAFDTEGWLIDGQHRLAAVSLSGVSCEFWIFPDQPRDTFDKMDSGRARAAHQLLNGSYPVYLAAAARFLVVADGTHAPVSKRAAYARLDNTETLAEVRKWGSLLQEAVRCAANNSRGSHIAPGPHAALLAQALTTRHADRISDWLHGLATGAMLDETDPRLRLRTIFANKGAAAVRDRTKSYAVIVKGWNAFVQNRPVKNISFRDDEAVPAVIGYRDE